MNTIYNETKLMKNTKKSAEGWLLKY